MISPHSFAASLDVWNGLLRGRGLSHFIRLTHRRMTRDQHWSQISSVYELGWTSAHVRNMASLTLSIYIFDRPLPSLT